MDLTTGIVSILGLSGKPAGTGFVVADEGLIATCAHVLGEPMPEKVAIIFQATGEQRDASVEQDWWRASNAEDVAFLRVEGGLPDGVKSLPLGSSSGTEGQSVSTFGFPRVGNIEGVWGHGTVLGRVIETGLPLLQLRSGEITEGFSGAPVWDEIRGRVVGMVTEIATPDPNLRLTETAFATPSETLRTVCPALGISEVCPYRGLHAFTEVDAPFFFGRERVVDLLVESLQREETRFLAVLGPSGSGKSSLIQAGLIPQLRRGVLAGSDRWGVIFTRPADAPFEQLAAQELIGGSRNLKAGVEEWLTRHREQTRLLLVIDQFEELLTVCPEELRRDFVNQLSELLQSPLPVTIVLVMRDDFYSRFTRQEALVEWLERGLVNVPSTLRRDELIAIVQAPARAVGLRFSEGLVEAIVKDVMETAAGVEEGGQVGHSTVLPLLEFALTQLWERRQDGMLTRAAYDSIGGVTGGLAQWADQTFYNLEEKQRQLALRIFMDLVSLGDESQGVPNSRQRKTLTSLCRNTDEQEDINQVVQRLVDARLLVTGRDARRNEETVEIVHSALLWEWGKLQQWLIEDRRFLVWHQELERRVRGWINTNPANTAQRDEDKLLRGRELGEAEGWMGERKADLSEEEQAFIQASRRRQMLEAQQWKDLYEEAEHQRREAERQREEAEHQRRIALARQLAAQAELTRNQQPHLLQRSVLLAVEAMRRFPSLEADQALRHGLALLLRPVSRLSHERPVRAVAFSPDGNYLATASEDGTAGVWEILSGHQLTRHSHERPVRAVAFSPDGNYLATASEDGTAGIWETLSDQQLFSLIHTGPVRAVAFSPDGNYIATASEDGTAGIWEIASGQQLFSYIHTGPVSAVVFSLDGTYLGTASDDHTARIWEVNGGKQLFSFTHGGPVKGLAFSPDSKYLATACRDHTTRVWETTTGQQLFPLIHEGNVWTVAFSPDGTCLVTAGDDHTVGIWETVSGRQLNRLTHKRSVGAAVFSPDSNYLATASEDHTARMWGRTDGLEVGRLVHENRVNAVSFSNDGHYLATASEDGTADVWETTWGHQLAYFIHEKSAKAAIFSPTGRYLATASGDTAAIWEISSVRRIGRLIHENRVNSVAFSPDERYLATASIDHTVRVWEVTSGQQIVRLTHEKGANAVAFSPDGRCLASASGDATAGIWKMTSGQRLARLSHNGSVNAVAFSPDGRYLATTSNDRTVRVWNATTGVQLAQLTFGGWTYAVAFSRDGRYVAASSEDGSIEIWEVPHGSQIARFSHRRSVRAIAFGPEGRLLATASNDSTAGIWEVATGHQLARLTHEGAVNAVAFSPDGRYLATASKDCSAGVWEVATGRQLARITHEEDVSDAAFSPNGKYVATACWDGTAGVWLWQPDDLIAEACRRLTRNLTLEEWQQHLEKEEYRKTCPNLSYDE